MRNLKIKIIKLIIQMDPPEGGEMRNLRIKTTWQIKVIDPPKGRVMINHPLYKRNYLKNMYEG